MSHEIRSKAQRDLISWWVLRVWAYGFVFVFTFDTFIDWAVKHEYAIRHPASYLGIAILMVCWLGELMFYAFQRGSRTTHKGNEARSIAIPGRTEEIPT